MELQDTMLLTLGKKYCNGVFEQTDPHQHKKPDPHPNVRNPQHWSKW